MKSQLYNFVLSLTSIHLSYCMLFGLNAFIFVKIVICAEFSKIYFPQVHYYIFA